MSDITREPQRYWKAFQPMVMRYDGSEASRCAIHAWGTDTAVKQDVVEWTYVVRPVGTRRDPELFVRNCRGVWRLVNPGDYVVAGHRAWYPVPADVFEATYKPVGVRVPEDE